LLYSIALDGQPFWSGMSSSNYAEIKSMLRRGLRQKLNQVNKSLLLLSMFVSLLRSYLDIRELGRKKVESKNKVEENFFFLLSRLKKKYKGKIIPFQQIFFLCLKIQKLMY